jgi:O-antigen ligase
MLPPSKINNGHVFGIAFILIGPIAVFAPKGMVPLFILTTLILLARNFNLLRSPRQFYSASVLWLGCFFVLCIISAVWSISISNTISTALPLLAMIIGGVFSICVAARLDDSQIQVFRQLARIGMFLFTALLFVILLFYAVEPHTGADVNLKSKMLEALRTSRKFNPAISILVLCCWSGVAAIVGRSAWAVVAAISIILIVDLKLAEAEVGLYALTAGIVFAVIAMALKRRWVMAIPIIVCLGMLAAPFLANALLEPKSVFIDHKTQIVRSDVSRLNDSLSAKSIPLLSLLPMLSNSLYHRIFIWQAAAQKVSDQPIFGFGFDASRNIFDSEEKEWAVVLQGNTLIYKNHSEKIPLHPHNLAIQIWLELGAAGILVFVVFLIVLFREIGPRFQSTTAKCLLFGFFGSIALISFTSYGAWQNWWVASILMAATMIAASADRSSIHSQSSSDQSQ